MRIIVHIGPDGLLADRVQRILDAKRGALLSQGVLYARTPGARNHTRLYMAVTDPDNVESLRHNRGFADPGQQAALRADVGRQLAQEVARHGPDLLILSAHQLGSALARRSELARLRDLLLPLSDDIRIVAHLDDPARMLARRYAAQVLEGRAAPLARDLGLLDAPDFRDAALATWPENAPHRGVFPDIQGAPFWLDAPALAQEWDAVFGPGATTFHHADPHSLYGPRGTECLRACFAIDGPFGKAAPEPLPVLPSAAWLTRARLLNDALLRLLSRQALALPRPLWRKFLGEIKVPGDALPAGGLSAVSRRFSDGLERLCKTHPGLDPAALQPDPRLPDWQETDPTRGFRATQYLMVFRKRLKPATPDHPTAHAPESAEAPPAIDPLLSPVARAALPPLAKQNFVRLQSSRFAPHNRLGHVNEEALAAAFTAAPPRPLPEGSSGNVIVGCMKNEGPYIVEWVAYHRTIGFDDFLIYTNGCEDGTTGILDRLQALGVLQHRDNDRWSGKSPQQHALDQSLTEPVIRDADWIAHIDVDEFINIRCGNGTLRDLFDHAPDATNIAMTWRLFGHNGVTRLQDALVIDQFDGCAPKYCPKPHTAWGFKTLFRNIGAYGKLSCHRPNKLAEGFETRVKWVNGSGHDMTPEAARNGWRNSRKTIGYDLVQLNHYALRSAESFLIKRQRGRALHVDRNIGLNYWIRMDWSAQRDITIKRNIPRLRAEYDALLADPVLCRLHADALDWHRAKADELHANPEFADLYRQALAMELTETERVAFALALDMET